MNRKQPMTVNYLRQRDSFQTIYKQLKTVSMKQLFECPAHDINLSGINTGNTSSLVAENLMPGTLHAGEDIEPGTLHAGEDIEPGTLHAGEDIEPGTLHAGEDIEPWTLHVK